MQISGVSLTLTWPRSLCLLRVLLGATTTATSFPLSKHTGGGDTAPLSQAGMFIYSSCRKWVFPRLLWSFPPSATFTSFPAPGCWACAGAPASPAGLLWGISPLPLWCSGHPALFAMCLFCCYCLLFSFFSFFPGWGSVCPGGYADLAQGYLWECHVVLTSPCGLHLPKQSGCWCLVAARSRLGFSI
jgi:hypothetical protein